MLSFIAILITVVVVYCIYREQQKRLEWQKQEKKRIEEKTKQLAEEREKRPERMDTKKTPLARRSVVLNKIDTFDDKKIKEISEYVVLDLETTGLDPHFNKIIEIGLIRVINNEIVDKYSTFVNPEVPIPKRASEINGIYDADVQGAPRYNEVADTVKTFLQDKIILGYNVGFDLEFIEFLLRPSNIYIDLTYFDVLPYARRVLHGLPNYKLQTVSEYLKITQSPNHRAMDDVLATDEVFRICKQKLCHREEERKRELKEERERKKRERIEKYQTSPLLEVAFVFTGEFSIDRSAMEQMADSVGALIRDKVTSNTDYLVVGKLSNLPDWAIERKYKKAKQLQENGKKVKLIDEAEYLAMIASAKSELNSAQTDPQ